MRVCPTTRWHCSCTNDVMAHVQRHQKWHQSSKDAFSALFFCLNMKNKKRHNLEWSHVVPNCTPLIVQECPIYPSFCERNHSSCMTKCVYWSLSSLLMAATMIYKSCLKHITFIEHIYIHALRSRCHVLWEAGKPIYIYCKSVDRLTGAAGSSS